MSSTRRQTLPSKPGIAKTPAHFSGRVHLRFILPDGTTHSIGQVNAVSGIGFGIKIVISLAGTNASLSLKGILSNHREREKDINHTYSAIYPRHGQVMEVTDQELDLDLNPSPPTILTRSSDEVSCANLSFACVGETNFVEIPGGLLNREKITHYLTWSSNGAITESWNSQWDSRLVPSPETIAEIELFHLVKSAVRLEAWSAGGNQLTQALQTFLQSTSTPTTPAPTSNKAGERLRWDFLPPLAGKTTKSHPAQYHFANSFSYEMVMKTAVLREREVVIKATEVLLQSPHRLALAHLHSSKTPVRSAEETTAQVVYYKAWVRLYFAEGRAETHAKLDAGLKVEVSWTRALHEAIGTPLLESGLYPTWSGHVAEMESDTPFVSDVLLILRKPKDIPAPPAAEPNMELLPNHVYTVFIKATLNETSAKRQFTAISKLAADPDHPLWPVLLNQAAVSPQLDVTTSDLAELARQYHQRLAKEEMEKEMKRRSEVIRLIKERESDEEKTKEAEAAAAERRVAMASTLIDGLNINPIDPDTVDWHPNAPDPELPAGHQAPAFWEKSAKEMEKEEVRNIEDFTAMRALKTQDTNAMVAAGLETAKKIAKQLNQQQLVSYNNSCRLNPGLSLATGPPGTGKSLLINHLIASYAAVGMPCLVTAPNNYAANVLAFNLFRGAKTDRLTFHRPNSLGISYKDIVRVLPEQEETLAAKTQRQIWDFDETILHLMRAEAESSPDAGSKDLTLAAHIYRLAFREQYTTPEEKKQDLWHDYREHILGRSPKRGFRQCYNEIAAAVMRRAKIIVATLNTSQIKVIRRNFSPSLIVVDEAGQATEPDILIPLVGCRDNVACRFMAGDEKQLAATVLSLMQSEQSDQLQLSLFSRLGATGTPTCMLDVQYRMLPEIAELPNHQIYGGALKDDPSTHLKNRPAGRDFLKWCSYAGAPRTNSLFLNVRASECLQDEATHSRYNRPHLAALVRVLDLLTAGKNPWFHPSEIIVLSYYQAQRTRLRDYLRLRSIRDNNPRWKSIEVATVDSYQGRECSIVIVDLVIRGGAGIESLGFVRSNNRLNVAHTRAKNGLIIVGYAAGLLKVAGVNKDCFLLKLANDAVKRNACWDAADTSRDWRYLMEDVLPDSTGKRDRNELKMEELREADDFDAWELEEFRTGKYSSARDVQRPYLEDERPVSMKMVINSAPPPPPPPSPPSSVPHQPRGDGQAAKRAKMPLPRRHTPARDERSAGGKQRPYERSDLLNAQQHTSSVRRFDPYRPPIPQPDCRDGDSHRPPPRRDNSSGNRYQSGHRHHAYQRTGEQSDDWGNRQGSRPQRSEHDTHASPPWESSWRSVAQPKSQARDEVFPAGAAPGAPLPSRHAPKRTVHTEIFSASRAPSTPDKDHDMEV